MLGSEQCSEARKVRSASIVLELERLSSIFWRINWSRDMVKMVLPPWNSQSGVSGIESDSARC